MEEAQALLRRVMEAYAEEGFPAEIIGQWTLPATDAGDLVAWVRERDPARILEVGTFVGVSTMLLALTTRPDGRIVSIDPNFPLSVEMSSMGSRLGAIDAAARTQSVATRVARRLGVAHKITLVAGGFSAGASFASRRVDPALDVPVVGPETCARSGPFDLAFIDGLHYADVVRSDVELVSRHMRPDGVILMHDCVGMWGSNVRAGIFRFLADNPGWRLLHPPYRALYRSIGVVFRPANEPALAARLSERPQPAPGLEAQLQSLAMALLRQTGTERVLELTLGEARLVGHIDAEGSAGEFDLSPLVDGAKEAETLAAELAARLAAAGAPTLVVAPGSLDALDDAAIGPVLAAIARSDAPAVLMRTPPGEEGAALRHSRPLRRWAALAGACGGTLYEVPLLDVAPNRFLFVIRPVEECPTSGLSGVTLFAGPVAGARIAERGDFAPLCGARLDAAEQDELLAVHYGSGFASTFQQLGLAQDALAKAEPTLREWRDERARMAAQLGEIEEKLAAAEQRLDWQERVARERAALRPWLVSAVRFPRAFASRILDDMPDVVVEEALRHAWLRGHQQPCVMLSWAAEPAMLDALLADPRVGSVGTKDADPTRLARRHAEDPRVGRYFHHGGWMLPNPRRVVYFVGSWRLMNRQMLREATRAGVEELNVRLGTGWATLRPQAANRFASSFRVAERARTLARHGLAVAATRIRDTGLLPERFGPPAMPLPKAFSKLVASAPEPAPLRSGRVVLVSGNLSPGGAERQVANTLVGLARRGIKAELLAHFLDDGPSRHGFHLPRVRAAGVPAREIRRVLSGPGDPRLPAPLAAVANSLPPGLLTDIGNLLLEFQELRPEVVHAWLDWDNIRAGFAAVLAGVPCVVISGRNLNPSHFTLYQPYMDPAYRALAMLPQVQFVNNSRAGADDYADWIGMPRERIRVLHNGFDFGTAERPSPDETAQRRLALGMPRDAFVVGGVFRLDEEKRPLLWLEAAAYIAKYAPEARFVIHGQGSLRRAMEARINAPDLAGRVTLAGVTDDPLRAMSLFDVLLLTSHGEGLPNVLLEAQAVGTGVVTTSAGGAVEAIWPDVTGWVVEEAAPAAIAARVLALRDDPVLLARAAEVGPRFVEERFGLERMITGTLELYDLGAAPATPQQRVA